MTRRAGGTIAVLALVGLAPNFARADLAPAPGARDREMQEEIRAAGFPCEQPLRVRRDESERGAMLGLGGRIVRRVRCAGKSYLVALPDPRVNFGARGQPSRIVEPVP